MGLWLELFLRLKVILALFIARWNVKSLVKFFFEAFRRQRRHYFKARVHVALFRVLLRRVLWLFVQLFLQHPCKLRVLFLLTDPLLLSENIFLKLILLLYLLLLLPDCDVFEDIFLNIVFKQVHVITGYFGISLL